MSKKKRPNQKPTAPAQPSGPIPHVTPVTYGDIFATFVDEARQIGNEVVQRRAHQDAVDAFLKSKGLVDEFTAWLKAR